MRMDIETPIEKFDTEVHNDFDKNLFQTIKPINVNGDNIYFLELSEDEFSRADIDLNGSVDVFDLMYISNIILGW
tara:strand:- start:173 stop:397 length:225 start_codon:yes stop_codon:yes gene_type:complete